MFQIFVYVPEAYLDAVKNAMFAAGAGKIGDYDSCSWQTLGDGQFRPLNGSQPFIGNQDELETTPEYKVEMVFDSSCLEDVVSALQASHPYETPAYGVVELAEV